MKLEDGSEIQFLEKPYWRDDFWCGIKITKNDQVFGVAFDEESYLEFIRGRGKMESSSWISENRKNNRNIILVHGTSR